MVSVEGLAKVGNLVNQGAQQTDQLNRQLAVRQAAQQYKNGDIQGAYTTLAAADPDWFKQAAANNPQLQGQLAGAKEGAATEAQLSSQTQFNSNPSQLTQQKGQFEVEAAQARANAMNQGTSTFKDQLSGLTGVKDKKGNILGYVGPDGQLHSMAQIQGQSGQPGSSAQVAEAGSETPIKPPKLLPNQDIDSNGDITTINPNQRKIIDSARKTFDSETKDLVKSMDNLSQADKNIQDNIPGQGTIEKLRILRGVVQGRINQQEFQAFGQGMGILNSIDNAISQASGKGMSPDVQQLMARMVKTAEDVTSKEFDQHLQNAVDRNPDVDPFILKKRLVGNHGPAIYQQLTDQVKQMPADAQALFNWAHENPGDPKAQFYLQQLSNKFGLGKQK